MDIVYRELETFEELEQCKNLQQEIFGINDLDTLSPLFLNVLTRKFPKIGINLGTFHKEKLIGFLTSLNTANQKYTYGILFGVLNEYRNQGIGINIYLYFRKICENININHFFGIFDPLEGNLGHLYFNKLGFVGKQYEKSPYELSEKMDQIPIDKVFVHWDMISQRVEDKIEKRFVKKDFNSIYPQVPIVSPNKIPDSDAVLVEIPLDFLSLKKIDPDKAYQWRMDTRILFDEYINKRNYVMQEFYSYKENSLNRNFYYLKKK